MPTHASCTCKVIRTEEKEQRSGRKHTKLIGFNSEEIEKLGLGVGSVRGKFIFLLSISLYFSS